MNRVLVLESSATRRRAVHASLTSHGFQVSELPGFEHAPAILKRLGTTATNVRGLVMGWPEHHNALAGEVFAMLRQDEFEHFAVVLLADTNNADAVNWMMKRPSTDLLLWSDYNEAADSLNKLINPPAPAVLPNPDVNNRNNLRILFVDDSATVRIAFRRLLTMQGYHVETAENAADGWAKAQSNLYDIAIVDYFMPGDAGTTLVQRMKENPRTASILSAVITGTYSDRVIKESLAAGALECLFKSEARELFLARLGSLARAVQDRKSIDAERRRLSSILNSVGDGVYGVDDKGVIQFINPAAIDLLGFQSSAQLIGKSAYETFHHTFEDGTTLPRAACFLSQCYAQGSTVPIWQTVFWSASKRAIPVECTVYPIQMDGRREGSVVAFRDISARRILEDELRWQANHDILTKLYNRAWFETQLEQEIARIRRTEQVSLLLFVDLDRFKYINDTAGHTAGDQLLVEISHRLKSRLRASDQIARMGGDEYAIILHNVNNTDIVHVADEFRKALSALPFAYGGKSYRVSVSIGVCLLDQHTVSRTEAMANADIALHQAKDRGRNQIQVFSLDSDQRAKMDTELGWSSRLVEAIKKDQFILCYQPILPLAHLEYDNLPHEPGALWTRHLRKNNDKRAYYEVLVRLQDSEGKLINPAAFLPSAERFSLIGEIDRWVVRHALKALREHNLTSSPTGLTINLSPHSLAQPGLARYITDRLVEFNIDPNAVIFEITESGALHQLEAARTLIRELRAFGCRFALDDFGVGFSSFTHLKHLDVDFLKIDGSFTQGLLSDQVDLAVINAITSIAHSIGKFTIAECVEHPEILRALRNCNVDYAQGYYIGRPKPSLRAAAAQLEMVHGKEPTPPYQADDTYEARPATN